jgi:hypothetical protein
LNEFEAVSVWAILLHFKAWLRFRFSKSIKHKAQKIKR